MKKNIGSVTIDHVATAAKVSTATVSRALNKPESVSAELKEKIYGVIKKLGYIPNAGARSLVLKRSGTVGAIVPTLDNAIFSQGLAEFQKQLNQVKKGICLNIYKRYLSSHFQVLSTISER